MSSNIPEPWASRLIERGFIDGRRSDAAVPSASALAAELKMSVTTVTNAIHSKRATDPDTVLRLASKLGEDVIGWLGFDSHGPWEPPTEVILLTPRQRKAITELIRSIATDEQGRGGGRAGSASIGTDINAIKKSGRGGKLPPKPGRQGRREPEAGGQER